MKRLLFALVLTISLPLPQGCQTPVSQRSEAVTTLKVLAASVDASMRVASGLRHDGKLTAEQWDRVSAFFDTKFRPAFNLAVAAVQSDLSSAAGPDLLALAGQLAALIQSFQ